ncbi:type I-E CRISPR-associated protein Cas5/CasD [Lactiplantibacillus modestisalitolerans]|uniref:Type I-E CRISPR-associated protein Cas5/CasD n=1 Tax=Lactiplantibacillus modestisalitolerans TaxID=1457219 RepID=A0ABV5WRG8_9LACO|nr:type I-E CRISPR-associated protein Cas5/CasD [Lactiplantibacillus modestisalitolerans]
MKTLTFNLTAPLQSYGNEATFERRTTTTYPSKSAIIGLLAAALGYRRRDERIQTLNALQFAVRIDQAGVSLTDYHVVEWKTATRKVTYRDYLQDARFVVALGSEDEQLLERLQNALTHPRFQLFLGRRANTPAGPLQALIHDGQPVDVLTHLKWQAAAWYQRRQRTTIALTIMADADLLAGQASTMVKDRMVSFDQRHRQYGFRAMSTTTVELSNPAHTVDYFSGI